MRQDYVGRGSGPSVTEWSRGLRGRFRALLPAGRPKKPESLCQPNFVSRTGADRCDRVTRFWVRDACNTQRLSTIGEDLRLLASSLLPAPAQAPSIAGTNLSAGPSDA